MSKIESLSERAAQDSDLVEITPTDIAVAQVDV